MTEIPEEERDRVREELVSIAERLRKLYGASNSRIKRFLREMLTVSI